MDKGFKRSLVLIAYIAIIIISFFKIYSYVFEEKTSLLGDNAGYYILGKSLASGEGYTNIHGINKSPANHFPPGYPLLVSAVMKYISYDILVVKKVNGFFLLLSLIIIFFLFRKLGINIHLSFIVTLLLLLNSHILIYSTIMMSEISFLLFSCLSLLLFINIKENKNPLKQYQFYLFIIVLSFSFYIRTLSIAMLGGYILFLLINKKWKLLSYVLIGYIGICAPWIIRGQMLGGSSYMNSLFMRNPYKPELGQLELTDWLVRILMNFERYITREIPSSIYPFITIDYKADTTIIEWILGLITLALIIFGLLKLKNYRTLFISILLGSFGILLLWPEVWTGTRFMQSSLPILLLLNVIGIYNLFIYLLKKIRITNKVFIVHILPFAFLLSIPKYMVKVDYLHAKSKGVYGDNYKNYFEAAKWVKENIKNEDVICCRKPQLFYLFSERPVTMHRLTLDSKELIENLHEKNVKYIILDQLGYSSTGRYLVPAIKAHNFKFKLAKKIGNPETYIFEFKYEYGYHGEWKDGKRNGSGYFKFRDGTTYNGEWKDGVRCGRGTITWSNGNKYIGEWENDKQHGGGQLIMKDGKTFQGIWENGKSKMNSYK